MNPMHRSDQRGFILVAAVILVLALSILGAALLAHGPAENSLILDRDGAEKAFYHAEAGLRRGLTVLGNANSQLGDVDANRDLGSLSVNLSKVELIRAYQYNQGASTPRDSVGQLWIGNDPKAGPVLIMATGKAATFAGMGGRYRTIAQLYNFAPGAPWDTGGVANSYGGSWHLDKEDTLVGRIRVGSPSDSAELVNYDKGFPIPADSVRVVALQTPDFGTFISQKKSGGYQTITSGDIASADSANPLRLGVSNNGIYYSSSGLNVPLGLSSTIEVYGTVYLMVNGPWQISKDLRITAGNAGASLVVIANVSGPTVTGLDFGKVANVNDIPLLMMTPGEVFFRKAGKLTSVSIYGSSVHLAKQQFYVYNHAKLDPFILALLNSNLGLPGAPNQPQRIPTAVSGTWVEINPPRHP